MTNAEGVTSLDWLLDSDPAIRWRVLRDLADARAEVFSAERVRVAREERTRLEN